MLLLDYSLGSFIESKIIFKTINVLLFFFHIASMLPQRLCVAVYILYSNICEHLFKYPFIPYIDFNFLIFAGKTVHFERKIMYTNLPPWVLKRHWLLIFWGSLICDGLLLSCFSLCLLTIWLFCFFLWSSLNLSWLDLVKLASAHSWFSSNLGSFWLYLQHSFAPFCLYFASGNLFMHMLVHTRWYPTGLLGSLYFSSIFFPFRLTQ